MRLSKYVIIPIIALGITLSMILGIEYNCEGPDMFPTYYGSPFVFKQKSLGSSMEYFYSIFGLILNVAVWTAIVAIVRFWILKWMSKRKNVKIIYKVFVGFLLVFSMLNVSITYIGIGRGFNENLNYWYWNLDKEASDWGMKCEGDGIFYFIKNRQQ